MALTAAAAAAARNGGDLAHLNYIQNLKTQIKSNGALLFPKALWSGMDPQVTFDIVFMTDSTVVPYDDNGSSAAQEKKSAGGPPSYRPRVYWRAVLVYPPSSMSAAKRNGVAAKGGPSETRDGALEELLLVLAQALEQTQGTVFQDIKGVLPVGEGLVDGTLIYGKNWVG